MYRHIPLSFFFSEIVVVVLAEEDCWTVVVLLVVGLDLLVVVLSVVSIPTNLNDLNDLKFSGGIEELTKIEN